MLSQELGLGRGELAIGQRALPVQRSQRFESGRNPRALDTLMRRRRRHDHAVDRVAWRWRAEPVSVMAPRVPTMMQARRVRVSPVSQEPGRIAPMAARQGRVRVPVPPVPRYFLPDSGRVVQPLGLLRRISTKPVGETARVARPQRGRGRRERRLRLMRLA